MQGERCFVKTSDLDVSCVDSSTAGGFTTQLEEPLTITAEEAVLVIYSLCLSGNSQCFTLFAGGLYAFGSLERLRAVRAAHKDNLLLQTVFKTKEVVMRQKSKEVLTLFEKMLKKVHFTPTSTTKLIMKNRNSCERYLNMDEFRFCAYAVVALGTVD